MFSKKEYVYAVYTEKSFTKAANKLYISQPCLSAAIKKVEQQVGMPLFERRYCDLRLTELGERYIRTTEKIMELENDFVSSVTDITRLEYGSIVIGGSNYVCSYILPRIVSEFTKKYPKIDIDIVETNSVDLERKVASEEVDIIVDSFDGINEMLECTPLLREWILLAVPCGSSSNSGLEEYRFYPSELYEAAAEVDCIPELDINCFCNEKFILLKNGNSMYRHARTVFDGCGFVPDVVFRMDQLLTSFSLAQSGNGACFVTSTMFKYHKFPDNVCLYRIKNSGERMLYIAKKKNKYTSAAVEAFTKCAVGTIKD